MYLIKWEGYPSDQNTWEKAEDVFAKDLVEDFENKLSIKATQVADEFSPSKPHRRTRVVSSPETKDERNTSLRTRTRVQSPVRSPSPVRSQRKRRTSISETEVEDAETDLFKIVGVKTVTRNNDGKLMVHLYRYLTSKKVNFIDYYSCSDNGESVIMENDEANKKFPELVINFYESRIKFKS